MPVVRPPHQGSQGQHDHHRHGACSRQVVHSQAALCRKLYFLVIQWGSEIRKCLDLEQLKIDWFTNGPYFERNLKSKSQTI